MKKPYPTYPPGSRAMLLVLLCWLPCGAFAQLTNGNFENILYNCDNNGDGCVSFVSGCVPNWYRVLGSPHINRTGGINNSKHLAQWSQNSTVEGVYTNYPFQRGKTYRITFSLRSNSGPTGTLYLRGANGLVEITSSPPCSDGLVPNSSQTPTMQSNLNIINNSPVIQAINLGTSDYTSWTSVSIQFTNNSPSFNQMVIYPFTTGSTQKWAYIDGVNVEECCPYQRLIQNIAYTEGTTVSNAESIIQAGENVDPNTAQGKVIVSGSSTSVTYLSNYEIRLKPGFEARLTNFTARMEICPTGSVSCTTGPISSSPVSFISNGTAAPSPDALTLAASGGVSSTPADSIGVKGDSKAFDIYPNPVKESATISFASVPNLKGDAQVFVHDPFGVVVYTSPRGSLKASYTVNLVGRAKGVYTVRAVVGAQTFQKKFVKTE